MASAHAIAREDERQDDYCGRRFGRLKIVEFFGWTKNGLRLYRADCDCGNQRVVYKCATDRGHSKSCGCLAKELLKARNSDDLCDARFGRLTAKRPCGRSNYGVIWECLCDCGRLTKATSASLNAGKKRSCGCLISDVNTLRCQTHGATAVGREYHHEYKCWTAMKCRCTNKNHHAYHTYGGAGVKVCDQWLSDFIAFLDHIGPSPSLDHTIDRKNNNFGYEPGNVRWATRAEQNRNRGSNMVIVVGNKSMCRSEWARSMGVNPSLLGMMQSAGRLGEVFAKHGMEIEWVGRRKEMPPEIYERVVA